MFDPKSIDLSEFALLDWTVSAAVRESAALQTGLETLTTKQWNLLRKEFDLETRNIGGTWHCRIAQPEPFDDDLTEPIDLEEALAVRPSVVTFGALSTSLTPVNSSITARDITVNSLTLAGEAQSFVSQLDAFTAFLDSADTMLSQRQADLDRETALKEQALHQTRLRVEEIRQRSLVAQRQAIATRVNNEALDRDLQTEVTLGKSLHEQLSDLL